MIARTARREGQGVRPLVFFSAKTPQNRHKMERFMSEDKIFAGFLDELCEVGLSDFSKMIEESDEIERKAFERKGKKGNEEGN